jgi:hypothetical protein
MTYQETILQELQKVYGYTPKYVARNPYGGGTSYYDDEHQLHDSGLFKFDTEEKLDEFIRLNKHCYYLKVGSIVY